jgi:hypothetical protein
LNSRQIILQNSVSKKERRLEEKQRNKNQTEKKNKRRYFKEYNKESETTFVLGA